MEVLRSGRVGEQERAGLDLVGREWVRDKHLRAASASCEAACWQNVFDPA